jgi:maltooligosyltrehalose synthase
MRVAPSAPIGPDVWRDDLLAVPSDRGRPYCDLFTGRELVPVESGGRTVLKLADVFGSFPVAALLTEA